MKVYRVGGCVRDLIIGKEPHDTDYVVVGSTPEEMLSLGYKQVGCEFPVFLHPETRDEYALARKEVSVGDGYRDFKFDFNPNITLKEDLIRRDFTMNALAIDENGEILDYFDGVSDIKNKVIRHVSKHFLEDPLRVLRACRLAAQLDFKIHEDTAVMCGYMARKGMLDTLTPERVWKEVEKALHTPRFHKFLQNLEYCGTLHHIFPEVARLKFCKELPEYHPEGDTYTHTLLALQKVGDFVTDVHRDIISYVNFSVMCHDFGKVLIETNDGHYYGHDELGGCIIDELCDRLKVPNIYREMAKMVALNHMKCYWFLDMKIKNQYDFVYKITKFKNYDNLRVLKFAHACDFFGKDKEQSINDIRGTLERLNLIYDILSHVTVKSLDEKTQKNLAKHTGEVFGVLYREARISYLKRRLLDMDK